MSSKSASTPPSVTDQYLAALLAQPAVSTITLADGQPVPVEQVYVPRTLLHEVVQKKPEREFGSEGEAGPKAAAPEREITVKLPVELWPKLRDERVVLVEGPAGMGKSTLTKQLVRESGAHHLIPIWIPFRALVASRLSLRDYLDQHYVPWLGLAGLRVPYRADGTGPDRSLGQWCYEQWQSGLGLLIVDGLDEVFRHDERVTVLRGLPITGPGVTRPATILTSRPLSQSLPLPMAKVEVQGLTPSDQIQFIQRYRASLRLTDEQVTRFTSTTIKQEQGRLRELLTRPGHLIQILTTYTRTNILPDTETAILDQLLKSRLTITGRSDPPVEGDDAEKKRLVLASLALHLLACRQGQRHTRAQLLALIQQVLREHATHGMPLFPLSQSTALLNDLTTNSGLVTEVESDVYEFETVVWLQHLAGTALANQNTTAALKLTDTQMLDFLDKKAWDPEWEPVFKSWVAQVDNPFPLFTRLIDKKHDDLARHRLGTAGRCLLEVNSHLKGCLAYQTLSTQIPTEAFGVWWAELKRTTEELVETSIRKTWVETAVGQKKLLAAVKSRHELMFEKTILTLGTLGPDMPETVQQMLVARLEDRNKTVRRAAAWVIKGLGPTMPEVVRQALVAWLGDLDETVRRAAAWVITWVIKGLGPAMAEAVWQALVARLEDRIKTVRRAAAWVIKRLGPAMPEAVWQALVARLGDEDRGVRWVAVKALGGLGPAMPEVVRLALVARLGDEDRGVRWVAVKALGGLGPAMPEAVRQALVARLGDEGRGVRWGAVEALGGLGPAMPEAVRQALVARLGDEDRLVRKAAVNALGGLRPAMSEAVRQALVARLEDEDWYVRRAAVEALGGLRPAMPEVVRQALVARLGDEDWGVRRAAVEALGGLRPAMPEVVRQALVARLGDEDWGVRWVAVVALGGLGPAMPEVVRLALVARLEDEDWDVRRAAVEALGGLRPAMSEAMRQALVARLGDWDRGVRQVAVEALGGLGPAMPEAVRQALVARLGDEDRLVRKAAVNALGGRGPAMPEVVRQALVAQLGDGDEIVRREAARALSSAQQQGLRLFPQSVGLSGMRRRPHTPRQQGLRLFPQGVGGGPGRLVSDLSVTVPFSDDCFRTSIRSRSFLIPCLSHLHRTPLALSETGLRRSIKSLVRDQ